jgi:hypothetical protein
MSNLFANEKRVLRQGKVLDWVIVVDFRRAVPKFVNAYRLQAPRGLISCKPMENVSSQRLHLEEQVRARADFFEALTLMIS